MVVKLPLTLWLGCSKVTRAERLVGSLRAMVRGMEFNMPSTSVIIVNKDSSSKHYPCVLKKVIPEWLVLSNSAVLKPHP